MNIVYKMEYIKCRTCRSNHPKYTLSNIQDDRIRYCNQDCLLQDKFGTMLVAGRNKRKLGLDIETRHIKVNCLGLEEFTIGPTTWQRIGYISQLMSFEQEEQASLQDENGAFMLDQDPDVFRAILNIVIYGRFVIPNKLTYSAIISGMTYLLVDKDVISPEARSSIIEVLSEERYTIKLLVTGTPMTKKQAESEVVIIEWDGAKRVFFYKKNRDNNKTEFHELTLRDGVAFSWNGIKYWATSSIKKHFDFFEF